MASYKAKAIVLKMYKLGESDKIVKMYSKDHGIISAVAKGARKTQSKFGGRLELYNLVDLEIYKGRNLDVITQAELLKSFKRIPLDFYKFVFAEVICNIVLKARDNEISVYSMIFKLIYICLNEIDNLENSDIVFLKKVAVFFNIKFLKIIGYSPQLKNCCMCNRSLDNLYSFNKNKIFFSVKYGGVLCHKCCSEVKRSIVLNPSSYRLLYDFLNLKIEDFRDVEINSSDLKKIHELTEDYLKYHTDCNVGSFKYLNKLNV